MSMKIKKAMQEFAKKHNFEFKRQLSNKDNSVMYVVCALKSDDNRAIPWMIDLFQYNTVNKSFFTDSVLYFHIFDKEYNCNTLLMQDKAA